MADGLTLRWRQRRADGYDQDLPGHHGRVPAVALATIDGETVIVSGGEDGAVRRWDGRTGLPLGPPASHDDPVTALAVGVIGGQPVVVSGSAGVEPQERSWGDLRIWDVRTGDPRGRPFGGASVDALAVGVVDGELLIAAAGGDIISFVDGSTSHGKVRLYGASGAGNKPLRHGYRVEAVAVGALGDRAVVASASFEDSYGHTVRLWDARTGTSCGDPLVHARSVEALAMGVVDDALVLVSGSFDGSVRRWDALSGAPRGEPLQHGRSLDGLVMGSVDGRPVIISSGWGTVQLWDARSGAPLGPPLAAWTAGAMALGVIDDHPVIVAGSSDGVVQVLDLRTDNGQAAAGSHRRGVRSVAAGRTEGRTVVVSAGFDRTVRRWDARNGDPVGEPLSGALVALGTVNGQPVAVSCGWDEKAVCWDLGSGARVGKGISRWMWAKDVEAVAIGVVDDEPVIVLASERTVCLWDARTGLPRGKPLRGAWWGRRRSHDGTVTSVAIGVVDGEPVVVSGGADGTVRRWDARRGRRLGLPLLHSRAGTVTAVAVGVAGGDPVVVSGAADGTVRLWDARIGAARGGARRAHDGAVTSVVLGRQQGEPTVVSGSEDGTVCLWSEQRTTVIPVGAVVTSLALVEDGVAIATSSSLLVADVAGLSALPATAGAR